MPPKRYSAISLSLIVIFLLVIPIGFVLWLFGASPTGIESHVDFAEELSLMRKLSFISLSVGLLACILFLLRAKK